MTTHAHRRGVSELLWGYLAYVAPALAALISGPLIARALGPEGRGEVALVLAPLTLLDAFIALGAPVAAAYFAAKGVHSRYIVRTFTLPIVICAVIGCGLAYAWFLALDVGDEHLRKVFLFSLIAPVVGGFLGVFRGLRNGLAEFRRTNAALWLGATLRLCAIVPLFLLGGLNVATTVAATLAATAVGGLVMVRREDFSRNGGGDPPTAASIRRYAFSAWVGSLALVMASRFDQILLASLVPAAMLGLYAVAVSYSEIARSLFVVTSRAILTRLAASGDSASARRMARLSAAGTIAVAVFAIPATPPVVRLLFGDEFSDATRLAQILMLGTLSWGHGQNLTTILSALGRPGRAAFADSMVALACIATMLVAIPWGGTTGCAVALLGCYITGALWKSRLLSVQTDARFHESIILQAGDYRQLRSMVGRRHRSD